jgi:hypothetical protein
MMVVVRVRVALVVIVEGGQRRQYRDVSRVEHSTTPHLLFGTMFVVHIHTTAAAAVDFARCHHIIIMLKSLLLFADSCMNLSHSCS